MTRRHAYESQHGHEVDCEPSGKSARNCGENERDYAEKEYPEAYNTGDNKPCDLIGKLVSSRSLIQIFGCDLLVSENWLGY